MVYCILNNTAATSVEAISVALPERLCSEIALSRSHRDTVHGCKTEVLHNQLDLNFCITEIVGGISFPPLDEMRKCVYVHKIKYICMYVCMHLTCNSRLL